MCLYLISKASKLLCKHIITDASSTIEDVKMYFSVFLKKQKYRVRKENVSELLEERQEKNHVK